MRTLGFVLASFLMILACGGSNASAPSGAASPTENTGSSNSCSSDADCALMDHGCCSCCPEAPHAVTRSALEAQNQQCMVAECAACPKKQECPKVTAISSLVAKCESGACTAVAN